MPRIKHQPNNTKDAIKKRHTIDTCGATSPNWKVIASHEVPQQNNTKE
jgi:hypothetical protein